MGKNSSIFKSIKSVRRKSKAIKIGRLYVGAGNPIAIQSMTKTQTKDIPATLQQIKELQDVGCEIIRLAIKDLDDAKAIRKIKKFCRLPIVADIHFDKNLAIQAIDNGADKIRLNPGNIYKKSEVREIAKAARQAHIPIRVGVNSGSVKGYRLGVRSGSNNLAWLMVSCALDYIRLLEGSKFHNIIVSLKTSDIFNTVEAYRRIARICDYPLHLGLTATGSPFKGAIKSSIAIGSLLLDGIGDTIRLSLTDKPQEEVRVAKSILESLGLRHFGPEIISCPTCGRCEVDLIKVVKELELGLSRLGGRKEYKNTGKPIKAAIMGCIVNGPGEAKQADIGIAFGKKEGLLFKRGKPLRKVNYKDCIDVLIKEMKTINRN